jgi:hypothetical protein
MDNEMNVYWSIFNETMIPDIDFYEPENVYQGLLKNNQYSSKNGKSFQYMNCPAFKDLLNNTYSIKFPINYNLTYSYNQGKIFLNSDRYSQEFFNRYIRVRSIEDKLISIMNRYVFFSEEKLEMMQSSCHFHYNDFTKSNTIIPGKFNIGNWIRPVEIAAISNENDSITMKKGDEGCYITFLTEKKVNLIKFKIDEKMMSLVNNNLRSQKYNQLYNLQKWYEKFRMSKQKNYILKEIKNNLME